MKHSSPLKICQSASKSTITIETIKSVTVLVGREDLRPTAPYAMSRSRSSTAISCASIGIAVNDAGLGNARLLQMETFHQSREPHVCRPFDMQWSPNLHISTPSECLHLQ